MFRQGFLGGEVLDELDHLETLSGRELQESTEQAEAFDGTTRRRAELEVQLSREIEVLHLAPMTSIGLNITGRHAENERSTRVRHISTLNTCSNGRAHRAGCNYAKEQPFRQAQPTA